MVEFFQIPYMCISAPRGFVTLGQDTRDWQAEVATSLRRTE